MAGVGVDHMPDDILCNILSRLPPKPMGQCRCVSTRWNRLISAPSFLVSRSPTLFLEYDTHTPISIHMFEESNGSVTDLLDFSMFKGIPSIPNWDDRFVTIVGTFSGIVLFAVKDYIAFPWSESGSLTEERMVLYNPFTGVYEILEDPFSPFRPDIHAYGFGHGATSDDLKIFRFRDFNSSNRSWEACHVFNLKTRSWSQQELIQDIQFKDKVGTFLKGYLYWMGHSKVVALNVDKMVFSEIQLPGSAIDKENYLRTCNGCLWMITNTAVKTLNYDVWVMNGQGVDNSWSKACSLAIGFDPQEDPYSSRTIKITEDGRIIIFITMDDDRHMIIYDTSKHTYKVLKCQEEDEAETGIKYKESLTSPMNLCRVSGALPGNNPSGGKIKKSMKKKSKRRQNLKIHGRNLKIHGKIQKSKRKFKFRGGHWPLLPLWYRLCHV